MFPRKILSKRLSSKHSALRKLRAYVENNFKASYTCCLSESPLFASNPQLYTFCSTENPRILVISFQRSQLYTFCISVCMYCTVHKDIFVMNFCYLGTLNFLRICCTVLTNNLNLRFKTEPVATGADGTVYVWLLLTFIWHRNQT